MCLAIKEASPVQQIYDAQCWRQSLGRSYHAKHMLAEGNAR